MSQEDFHARLQRLGATTPGPTMPPHGNTDTEARDSPQQSRRKASTAARVTFSLLGYFLGATSYFYLYVASAARFIDTQMAHDVLLGGIGMAFLLLLVSVFLGLIGIFLRGFALWRVPVYYIYGVIFTLVLFRLVRVDLLQWDAFVDMLQS